MIRRMGLVLLWCFFILARAFALDFAFLPSGLIDEKRVRAFYEAQGFAPVWFSDEGQALPHVFSLQKALLALPDEALNPNRYHYKLLKKSLFKHPQEIDDWQVFEFILTDSWLAAAKDLSDGLLDAKRLYKTWNAPEISQEALFMLFISALDGDDFADSLQAINQNDALYQRVKKAYQSVRSDDLALQLERLRWLPNDWHQGNYVLVNTPEFMVRAYRLGDEVYKTRAIVGTKSRKTPQFIDQMQFVVFSPYWNVPRTIFLNDKLPALKRNAAAFDHSYEVVMGDFILPPSAINWHSDEARGYTLRQKPGGNNALGRVKFLFPNQHAIYLHDTPNRDLFEKGRRDLSSGCVRLEDPLDFAQLLLQDDGWSQAGIKQASLAGRERWVRLKDKNWAVYLLYWTTLVREDGEVVHFEDIYQLDKTLLNAYKHALFLNNNAKLNKDNL